MCEGLVRTARTAVWWPCSSFTRPLNTSLTDHSLHTGYLNRVVLIPTTQLAFCLTPHHAGGSCWLSASSSEPLTSTGFQEATIAAPWLLLDTPQDMPGLHKLTLLPVTMRALMHLSAYMTPSSQHPEASHHHLTV